MVLEGLGEGRARCHILRLVEVLLHHLIQTLSIVNKVVLALLDLFNTPLFLLHFLHEQHLVVLLLSQFALIVHLLDPMFPTVSAIYIIL